MQTIIINGFAYIQISNFIAFIADSCAFRLKEKKNVADNLLTNAVAEVYKCIRQWIQNELVWTAKNRLHRPYGSYFCWSVSATTKKKNKNQMVWHHSHWNLGFGTINGFSFTSHRRWREWEKRDWKVQIKTNHKLFQLSVKCRHCLTFSPQVFFDVRQWINWLTDVRTLKRKQNIERKIKHIQPKKKAKQIEIYCQLKWNH